MVIKSWSRRGVLVGAGALAGCATTSGPLPSYLFSLTAWASGDKIEFLLLNTTTRPLRVINVIVQDLMFEVRDESGRALTTGFVELFPHRPDDDVVEIFVPQMARRLAPNRAIKDSMTARDLVSAMQRELGPNLDAGQTYRVTFQAIIPIAAETPGGLAYAKVRSRSLCDLTFPDGRPRMDCRSAA